MSRPGNRLAGLLAAITALAFSPAAADAQERPFRERTVYEDLQMFSQVLNQIRVNHPDEIDTHRLFMAAVEGLVQAADPHSYVIPYERMSPEKEKALEEGKLVRIPIAFRTLGGAHVVVSIHPASAAASSDILPGDELVTVDGQPVPARSEAELEVLLAGEEGTAVRLGLERRRIDGSIVRVERDVEREEVDAVSAVPVAMLIDSATGYVRVTTFNNDDVADDLHRAVERLEKAGMRRLILDLRDNGGGLLSQAGEVAGEFLPRGALVYTTEGRKKEVVDTVRVRRSFFSSARQYPMAVMVNQGTASAAELVAGALQDHDRALIAGSTTFGKALIMQGFPLTDGSLMVLVIGTIRTPCGRSIQREYRSISTRDYYRASAADRDRLSRPTCTTTGGRTVYGGGGITPDHPLEDEPAPLWLARIREQAILTRWVPGFIEDRRDALRAALAADEPRLADDAVEAFRAFAAENGVTVPRDDDADDALAREILLDVAYALGGAEALFRVIARTDPHVQATLRALAATEFPLTAAPDAGG